mgnify:CR=1 FL=1
MNLNELYNENKNPFQDVVDKVAAKEKQADDTGVKEEDSSKDASEQVAEEPLREDASGDEKSIVVVNGKNVSTIKIGNLEIMTEDLGRMRWDAAKKACADIGDGWRLPTKDELNILYKMKINELSNTSKN